MKEQSYNRENEKSFRKMRYKKIKLCRAGEVGREGPYQEGESDVVKHHNMQLSVLTIIN